MAEDRLLALKLLSGHYDVKLYSREMNDLLVANKTYTWKPFFVTKDNVKVTSITTRTITTGTLGYGSFDADDERTGSTAEAAN